MKGFPDYMFCRKDNGKILIVYLEFKVGKNKLTKEQKEFFDFHKNIENVFCYEVKCIEDAVEVLKRHRFIK